MYCDVYRKKNQRENLSIGNNLEGKPKANKRKTKGKQKENQRKTKASHF